MSRHGRRRHDDIRGHTGGKLAEINDTRRVSDADLAETRARLSADERMLAALALEHPEKVTESHPPGTQNPRRISPPGGSTIKAINTEGG